MNNERLITKQELRTRALGCGIRFFIAAALTASQLSDGTAPFALGSVCAAGPGAEGLSALLGTGLGSLLFLDFTSGLAHLAAAILIFTASNAFRGLKISHRPLFAPVVAGGMFFLIQLIYLLESPDPLDGLFPALAATVLTGVSAWAYTPLLQRGREELDPRGLFFLAVTMLVALEDVALAEISLGRLLMSCLVAFMACQWGMTAGAAAGICGGLMLDLGSGTMAFTAIYGAAGLAAGFSQHRGRFLSALRYAAAVLFLLLPMTDPIGLTVAQESAGGLLLFLLLPKRLFGGKRVQRPEPSAADGAAMAGLKTRLNRCAAAFRDLYDSMGRGTERGNSENPAIIFDRAAERTCRDCALCTLCWRKDYNTTFNALNDATPYLLERGRALAKDFPDHFSSRCIHLTDFLTAVNEELSAFLLRRRYRHQLEETRSSARRQYAQLSDLLSATAAGLEETAPAFAAASTCAIGAALQPKKGEKVCGDSVCSFCTDSGLWCLLLSDGMGTGEEARRESALTLRLMRQFLDAGVAADAALKTLNSALALRGAETQSFSTIDLLTLKPATGEAALYKYGAAPSYLKRGGRVRRITGGTLPAGLRGSQSAPDITRFQMEPGSFAVMISDGVADAAGDEWLQDLLAGWSGTDPQVLAGLILAEAVKRTDSADDCGVQVLYLDDSGANQLKKL